MSDNTKTLEEKSGIKLRMEFEDETKYPSPDTAEAYLYWLEKKGTDLRAENEEQAKRIVDLKKRIAEQDEEYDLLEKEFAAEREKNKRPDCEKCENQNRESYCRLCKWELKDEDNYK